MKKLYIPTTTLNFNNILSTESISPKSFYENRSFGYKRFSIVEPSKFRNTLIAYNKIPYFDINDNELDNYPIIIELSKDRIVKDLNIVNKINDVEIFQISETIYFHPNKIRLLFFNESDKKNALIKAEPSISTKLLPLYQDKIQIINQKDTFEWNAKYLEKLIERNIDIRQHVYDDTLINKNKGFYFCYTLGEIYPILTIRDNINTILDDNRHKKQQAQIDAKYQIIYKINEEENQYLAKIIKSSDVDIYKTINLNKNKLTSFTKYNDISELYKNIINDIIDFDRINNKEDFKINRFELLKKIGDNFKEASFNGKDKSIEYIRNLMKNIKNYEPFEVENIAIKHYDILLKSIAYFILKGDDLDKLLNTLKENNMKTFKMALGFWGALFGFSALPKTISNVLFEENTQNFINIQDFLKNMYQKIHNFEIQEDIKIDFIKEKVFNNQRPKQQQTLQENKSYNQTYSSNNIPKCPKCGADMLKKDVKKGKFQGYEFYGCSKYPKCKGKRNLEGNELNDNFKPIEKISNINNNNKTEIKIISDIFNYIYKDGESTFDSKKLKIKDIMGYLNDCEIKVPNSKRKFKISDIENLIQNDNRFEVIGKSPKYLQIKKEK